MKILLIQPTQGHEEKARKKLNGKAAKEFKCPHEACDLIDEAIELLEKALVPF